MFRANFQTQEAASKGPYTESENPNEKHKNWVKNREEERLLCDSQRKISTERIEKEQQPKNPTKCEEWQTEIWKPESDSDCQKFENQKQNLIVRIFKLRIIMILILFWLLILHILYSNCDSDSDFWKHWWTGSLSNRF